MLGKQTCKILKEIRQKIDENTEKSEIFRRKI